MDRFVRIARTLAIVVTGMTLATGCGVGADSLPFQESPDGSLLLGSYQYASLEYFEDLLSVRASVGLVDGDGVETLDYRHNFSVQEGVFVGPTDPGGRGYSIDGARQVTTGDGKGGWWKGRVTTDGRLAALTGRVVGGDPSLILMVRRDPTPDLADLEGSWHFVEWARTTLGAYWSFGATGTATIDDDSTLSTTSYLTNFDGDLDPFDLPTASRRFRLQADGSLILYVPATGDTWMRGGVSSDGNVILLGGTFFGGQLARMRVLVRADLATDASKLQGNYVVGGWAADGGSPCSSWGSTSLDGVGAGTWRVSSLCATGILEGDTLPIEYAVQLDGGLDLRMGPEPSTHFRGVVGPEGRYAFFGGGTSDDAPTSVFTLIR